MTQLTESFIKKHKDIIHGRMALNKQLPPYLQRETFDYDLFSKTAKQHSEEFEHYLDKFFNYDKFGRRTINVISSKQKVYRVYEKETGEIVADFMSQPNHTNLYKVISGIRYETLSHAKRIYKNIIDNPHLTHRHAKARFDLWNIEQFERDIKASKVEKIPNVFGVEIFNNRMEA